jgi:hypothetical protein
MGQPHPTRSPLLLSPDSCGVVIAYALAYETHQPRYLDWESPPVNLRAWFTARGIGISNSLRIADV